MKIRPKNQDREVIQWTGNNLEEIQAYVGTRILDNAGNYVLPNFDKLCNWKETKDKNLYALFNGNMWIPVYVNDYIAKGAMAQTFDAIPNDVVKSNYEVIN